MAFNLPPLPFPREPGTNNPYIATPDEAGGYVVPHGNYFKKKVGNINLWIPVSAEDPLPTENANIDVTLSALRNALLGTGNKTLTDLATALAPLATTEKQEELVSALGEILVQLQAGSPVSVTESVLPEGASTAEKQEALTALIGALDTAAVSDPAAAGAVIALLKGVLERFQAVEAKIEAVRVLLNTLAGEDFATQTTLAQILEKMIAAPATEAKQDSLATLVGAIEDKLDGVRVLLNALAGEDFATQTTLAQILAKLDGVIDGTTVNAKPIPQYYNSTIDEYEVLQGRNGAQRVELYDANGNPVDLAALIASVIAEIQKPVKLDGSTMEYYGKSTDTKPTSAKVGSTFFEIDTKTVYMWDGTNWVVI